MITDSAFSSFFLNIENIQDVYFFSSVCLFVLFCISQSYLLAVVFMSSKDKVYQYS